MSSPTGATVLSGRYRLVEVLAAGGMGTVWRAYDDVLDRPVAVKEVLLPPGLDVEARETLRRRTMREARAAAQLRHPAIVTVYDVVEHDGRPWIVMELVASESLDAAIRRRGSLPPVEAAGIGLRILDALVTAQAGGVQHRDIKPANVLLADDGRIVLTDFGIARHVGDETLTSAGLLVGSPNFLAPERARGLDSPGLASDLWSLGATLYAAVEGRPPFERNGPLPTLAAVVMDEPPAPQRAGPLRPVIDGLLIKNPEYRLDADRTRWWLQRALRGQGAPPPATGAAPSDPTRPFPQVGPPPPVEETPATDRPADSSAADVAAVATAAASAGSAAQSADAPRTPEAAATAPPAASPAATVTEPAAGSPDDPDPDHPDNPDEPDDPDKPDDPDQPGAPATAAPTRRGGDRRRGVLAAAALGVLAVLAVVVVPRALDSDREPDPGQAAPARTAAPSASAAASAARPTAGGGATSPSATSTTPSRTPTRSPGGASAAPVQPPPGFARYTDPATGFSVVVPQGWRPGPGRTSAQVDFEDPTSGRFLRIETSDTPQADPYDNWVSYEQQFSRDRTAYRKIKIARVGYGSDKGWETADWEFTIGGTHVLNRNILVNSRRAHALYWSTPESLWNTAQSRRIVQLAAQSFQPAPVG